MLARTLMIGIVVAALAGCGQTDPSVLGTWTGKYGDQPATLKVNSDTTFTLSISSILKGRWELDGSDLKLFRDVRNGGDSGFGDGGDGAFHLTLSPDHKSLTEAMPGAQPTVLTKQ